MPLIPLYYTGCVSRAYFDGGQSRTLAFALNILRLCNPLIFHMRVRSTCVTAVIFIFRLRFLCTLARFSPLIALSSYSSFSFFLSLFSLYSLIRYFRVFFCCFGALRVRSNSFNCPQTKWNKKKGHDAISAMCQNSVCEYICTHAANKRAHNANQSINDLVFIVRNTAMFVVVVLAVSISTLYLRLTFVIKCAMRSYRNIVLSHAH